VKKRAVIGIAILLAGGCVAWLWWLLATPDGLSMVLASLSRLTPVRISAARVTGRIADSFDLQHVEVRIAKLPLVISVGSLRLAWHPVKLIGGAVAVDRLDLADIVIEDNRPPSKEPVILKWPRVSGLLAGLQAWIGRFEAGPLVYKRSGRAAFSMKRIAFGMAFHHGMADVVSLSFESTPIAGSGTVEAGFLRPSLKVDGLLTFGGQAAGFRRSAIKADLKPAGPADEMAGPVSVRAETASGERMGAHGRVALSQGKVTFREVLLTHSAFSGRLEAEGTLLPAGAAPALLLRVRAKDLRRTEGAGGGLLLAGEAAAEGNLSAYSGSYRLAIRGAPDAGTGRGWQEGSAQGSFTGGKDHLLVRVVKGGWLGGTVAGDIKAIWREGVGIASSLRGRGLDPANFAPEWSGRLNVDLDADLERSGGKLSGAIVASLPESVLLGRPLEGSLRLALRPDSTSFESLDLRGRGFEAHAEGVLEKKLIFETTVSDLSGLVPGAEGSLAGGGWLRWSQGEPSGALNGKGSRIGSGGVHVGRATFAARLGNGKGGGIDLDVDARDIAYRQVQAERLRIGASGRKDSHTVDLDLSGKQAALKLSLTGALSKGQWEGVVQRVEGTGPGGYFRSETRPSFLVSSRRVVLRGLRLASAGGETLAADGDVFFKPLRGSLDIAWERIDLVRFQPLIKGGRLEGSLTGSVSVLMPEKGRPFLDARAAGGGRYEGKIWLSLDGRSRAHWDERGLACEWEITEPGGGRARGTLSAAGPPHLGLPPQADLRASWENVDIAPFRAFLPEALSLKGSLSGEIEGSLLPGKAVNAAGRAQITQGSVAWARRNGSASVAIQTGSAGFSWTGRELKGEVNLTLAAYGKIAGTFSVPLPARLPPAFIADGPFNLALSGEVREKGLLAAAVPGLVQGTRGIIAIDVRGSGTWRAPKLAGSASLKDGSVLLPAAGIRVEKITVEAELAGDSMHASRIRAESGGGWVEIGVDARLTGGHLSYEGSIRGEGFQALNRSDVRIYASPRITFRGNSAVFSARGDIVIPQMAIYGTEGENIVRASSDVVIVDEAAAKKTSLPLGLDIELHVILGDKVRVADSGIDSRLAGALDLKITGPDTITAKGTIRAVEGRYKAYGIRLTITRGNIVFDGPLERPTLDILAVRTVDEVTAGVNVTGTAKAPVVSLYSNRPMPDADKLAYIVLGHRLSTSDPGQSALFTSGADVFQGGAAPGAISEARRRLGLEGPEGTVPQGGASTVGLGRYLAPGFYVGIGRSLLTGENLVSLRYRLSKRWEVESTVGGATGADFFYRIEFD
jgi:translocation and assembly module TamB